MAATGNLDALRRTAQEATIRELQEVEDKLKLIRAHLHVQEDALLIFDLSTAITHMLQAKRTLSIRLTGV